MDDTMLEEEDVHSRQFESGDENDKVQEERHLREQGSTQCETHHLGDDHDHEVIHSRNVANDGNDDDQVEVLPVSSCEGDSIEDGEVTETEDENRTFRPDGLVHTEQDAWIADNCDKSCLEKVARRSLDDDEVDLAGNVRRLGRGWWSREGATGRESSRDGANANAHEAHRASRGGSEKSASDDRDGEISRGVAEVNGSDTEVPVEARGGDADDGQMQCAAPTQRDSPEVPSRAGGRREESCSAGSSLNLHLPFSSLASHDVATNQRRRGCGGEGDGGAQDIIRSQQTILSHGVTHDRAEYDGGVGSDGSDEEEEHEAVDGAQVDALSQLRLGSPSPDSPSKPKDPPQNELRSRAPSPPRRTGQGSGVFLARNARLVTSAAATATTGGAESIGATGYPDDKPRENLAASASTLEPPTGEGVVLATVAQAALSEGRSLPPPSAASSPPSTTTTASAPAAVNKDAADAKRAANLTLIYQESGRANALPKEGVSQGADHSASGFLSSDEPSRGRAGRNREGMAMSSSPPPAPAVGWIDAQIAMAASKPGSSTAGKHVQQGDLSRNRDEETPTVGAARCWLKPSRTNSNSATRASAPLPAAMATIATKGSSLTGTINTLELGGWIRRGRTRMADGGGARSACPNGVEDISDLSTQEGSLLSQSILGLGIPADRRALPPEPPTAATSNMGGTGREGQVEESSFEWQETPAAGAQEEEGQEEDVGTLTVLSSLVDTQDVLANGDLSQMERIQHEKQLEANRRIDRLLKSTLPGETDAVAQEEMFDEGSSLNPSLSNRDPRPCSGGTASQTGNGKRFAFTAGREAKDREGGPFDSDSDPAQSSVTVGKQDGLAPRRATPGGVGRGGIIRGAIVKGKQMKPSAEVLAKQKGGQGTLDGSGCGESGWGPACNTPAAYVGGLGSSKGVRKRKSPSSPAGIPQAQQKSVFSFDSAEDDDDGRVSAKKKRRGDSEPKSAEKLGGGRGKGKGKVTANSENDLPIRSAGIKRSINSDLNAVDASRGGSAPATGEKRDRQGKSSVSDTRPGASQQKAGTCQLSGVAGIITSAADQGEAPKRKEARVESSGLRDGRCERLASHDPDVSDVDEDADVDEPGDAGAGAAAAAEADARAMAEMQRFELTSGSGTGRDDDNDDDEDDDDDNRDERNDNRLHHQVADTAVAPRSGVESRRATNLDTSTCGGAAPDGLSAASTSVRTPASGAASASDGETSYARPSGTERVVHSAAIATTRYPRRVRAGFGSATGVTAVPAVSAEAVLAGSAAAYVISWPCLWEFLKLEGWKCVYSKQKLIDRLYLRPGQSQCSPYGEDGPFKSEDAVCDYVRRNEKIFASFRQFDEQENTSDESVDGSGNEGNCQSGSCAHETNVGVRSVSRVKDGNATRNGSIDKEIADDVPSDANVSDRGQPDGRRCGGTNGRNVPGQLAANRDNPGVDADTDAGPIVPASRSRVSSNTRSRKHASVGDGDAVATAQANSSGRGRARNVTSVLRDTSETDRLPNICGVGREGTAPSGSPFAGRHGEQLEEWSLARHREPRHKSQKKDPPHVPKPNDESTRDQPAAGKRRGRPPKPQMTKPVDPALVARPSSVRSGGRNTIGCIGDALGNGAEPHADNGTEDEDYVQTQEQPELRSALNMMQMEENVGCMVSSERDLTDGLGNTSDDQTTRIDARAGAAGSEYTAANRRTEDKAKCGHSTTAAVARRVAGATSAFPLGGSPQPRRGQTVAPRPVKRGRQATVTTTAFDPRVSPSLPMSDDRRGGDNGGPTPSRRHGTPSRLDRTRPTSPRSLVLNRGSADRGSSSGDGDDQHGRQLESPSSGVGNSSGLRCSSRRPLSNVGIILTGLSKDYRKKVESLIKAKGGTLITFPSGPGTPDGNYRHWISCGNSRSQSVNARSVIAVARPGNYRAPKYLFAAAAGVDIVHPSCIEQCTVCLETTNYLLPVGRSALLDRGLIFYPGGYNVHGGYDEISSNTSLGGDYDTWRPTRGRPFHGKSVLIHLGACTPHKPPGLELTLWAAGAQVATIGPDGLGGFLGSTGDSNSDLERVVNLLEQGRFECFIGLEEGSCGNSGGGVGSERLAGKPHATTRKQLVRAARGAGVQAGTMEWAAQCILHGRILDVCTCPWFPLEVTEDGGGSVRSLANGSRGGNGGNKNNGKGRTTHTCFFSYLTADQDSRHGGRYVAGDYVILSASAAVRQVGRVESFRRATDGTVKAIVTLMSISVESREISEEEKDGKSMQKVVKTSRLGARVIVVAPDKNYPCTYAFRDPNVFVQKSRG